MLDSNTINNVVNGGYCIGCGVCTALDDSPVTMSINEDGFFEPQYEETELSASFKKNFDSACPFSGKGPNENQLAEIKFNNGQKFNTKIGFYENCYAGHVVEQPFRNRGSSGGMGTWVLAELFNKGMIDYAIHIHAVEDNLIGSSPIYKYSISESSEDVLKSSKSTYYPIEMSGVLAIVKNKPARYAIVGVPCFMKAVARLSQINPIFNERIIFSIGLVCGHLKSENYTKYLAWQSDVEPNDIASLDFRVKKPGVAANNYFVTVKGMDKENKNIETTKNTSEFFGASWGYAFFMYSACNYCDDVVAETTDITIGDAWLPNYMKDWQGDNVIIVRNQIIQKLIDEAMEDGRLELDSISAEEVITSQSGGFRQRHEALSIRLFEKEKNNEWYPEKRIKPDNQHINKRLQKNTYFEKNYPLFQQKYLKLH